MPLPPDFLDPDFALTFIQTVVSVNKSAPTRFPGLSARNNKRVLEVSALLAAALSLAFLLIPLMPQLVGVGLDRSWAYGMSYAVGHGLSVGQDVVFTFGPYADLYTHVYSPLTDGLMLLAGFYLAATYAGLLVLLRKQWPAYFPLLLALALPAILALNIFPLFSLPDPVFYWHPLLVALYVFHADREKSLTGLRACLGCALVVSGMGLLPLIKASFLPLCLIIYVMGALTLWLGRQRNGALVFLASPLVSFLAWGALAGSSPVDLLHFLKNALPIISGYSEAMALAGAKKELVFFLLAAALVFKAGFDVARKSAFLPAAALLLSLLAYLFMVFKAGFVRHDQHAVIAASALLLSALVLGFMDCSKAKLGLMALSLLLALAITAQYRDGMLATLLKAPVVTLHDGLQGLQVRLFSKGALEQAHEQRLREIRQVFSLPSLPGSVDIYSYDQSYLLASGNRWNPRPVFQSYSAYTPALAALNSQHLSGSTAPDFVIFNVQPIDQRFPSLDDGASWPAILSHYQPVGSGQGYALLQRQPQTTSPELHLLLEIKGTLGQPVTLPATPAGGLWARAEIQPSLAGRVARLLFRLIPPVLVVEDGKQGSATFRAPSGELASGFLLSPFVKDTDSFLKLYSEAASALPALTSVTLDAGDGAQWLWQDSFTLRLYTRTPALPAK
jgi:hypothetical protein